MFSIVLTMMKEILLSIAGRIAFKSIAERFATRLIIYGLKKLESYPSNDVVKGTADDLIKQLQGKKLAVIDKEAK